MIQIIYTKHDLSSCKRVKFKLPFNLKKSFCGDVFLVEKSPRICAFLKKNETRPLYFSRMNTQTFSIHNELDRTA